MKHFLCYLILISCFACKKSTENKETTTIKTTVEDSVKENIDTANYNYVIAKNGVNVRNAANKIIGKLIYHEKTEVLSLSENEFEYSDNGIKYKSKKAKIKFNNADGFVFDSFLNEDASYPNKFYEIGSFRKGIRGNNYQEPSEIAVDSILEIEIVAKNFIEKRNNNNDFIIETNIKKSNGTYSFILDNGKKKGT